MIQTKVRCQWCVEYPVDSGLGRPIDAGKPMKAQARLMRRGCIKKARVCQSLRQEIAILEDR